MTTTCCVNGYYICDRCHRLDTEDLIEVICLKSTEDNPFILAERIFSTPSMKMHGPEHHFLVPAVLIAALYNHTKEPEQKAGLVFVHHRTGFMGGWGIGRAPKMFCVSFAAISAFEANPIGNDNVL